jgi:hypothetical protein
MRKILIVMPVALVLCLCFNATAIWAPAWQVNIADELDTGAVVYKDTYALGAGGNGVNAATLLDDLLKVKLIGWPDAGYAGPVTKSITVSSMVGGTELGKDARAAAAAEISWDIDLTGTAGMSGTETLSWTLDSVPAEGLTLKDFGSDASRSSLVASTDMKSASSYAFSSDKSSTRYIQVVLGATSGPEPVDLSIASVGGDIVLSWVGVSSANYVIYSTEDITAGWNVADTVSGIDGAMQWTDVTAGAVGKRFYKIETTN